VLYFIRAILLEAKRKPLKSCVVSKHRSMVHQRNSPNLRLSIPIARPTRTAATLAGLDMGRCRSHSKMLPTAWNQGKSATSSLPTAVFTLFYEQLEHDM